MAEQAGGCFDLHRVDWIQSYLAHGGGRMLCWYRAPDAESARMALRQLGSDMNDVWAGAVDGGAAGERIDDPVCVVGEFRLDDACGEAPNDARDAIAAALASHGLSVARSFASTDGGQLVCIFAAEDEQRVANALRAAGVSPRGVWRATPVTPTSA